MTDYLLLSLGIVFCIIGILGCLLPVLPGPPINYLALILLHFSRFADYSTTFLVVMAIITILVTVMDYIIPIWGTKSFGGTKAGMWGATIGMLAGIFVLPPVGLILGPFAGAFIGESLQGKSSAESLKASMGTLLGFFLGIGLKLAVSLMMCFYFIRELWR
jgi:uncharacterized protein